MGHICCRNMQLFLKLVPYGQRMERHGVFLLKQKKTIYHNALQDLVLSCNCDCNCSCSCGCGCCGLLLLNTLRVFLAVFRLLQVASYVRFQRLSKSSSCISAGKLPSAAVILVKSCNAAQRLRKMVDGLFWFQSVKCRPCLSLWGTHTKLGN